MGCPSHDNVKGCDRVVHAWETNQGVAAAPPPARDLKLYWTEGSAVLIGAGGLRRTECEERREGQERARETRETGDHGHPCPSTCTWRRHRSQSCDPGHSRYCNWEGGACSGIPDTGSPVRGPESSSVSLEGWLHGSARTMHANSVARL